MYVLGAACCQQIHQSQIRRSELSLISAPEETHLIAVSQKINSRSRVSGHWFEFHQILCFLPFLSLSIVALKKVFLDRMGDGGPSQEGLCLCLGWVPPIPGSGDPKMGLQGMLN